MVEVTSSSNSFTTSTDKATVTGICSAIYILDEEKSVSINKMENDKKNTLGFIFMCNAKTKHECYHSRVFGLPVGKLAPVMKIEAGTMLFLFEVGLKLLYGIYMATCNGGFNLEPTAFQGNFPAQVRFKIYKDCSPLHESSFKHAIQDNYESGTKFRPDLNSEQVKALMTLFRPISVSVPWAAFPLPPRTIPALVSKPPSLNPPPSMDEPYSHIYSVHQSHSTPAISKYTWNNQLGSAPPSSRPPVPTENPYSYIHSVHQSHATPAHDPTRYALNNQHGSAPPPIDQQSHAPPHFPIPGQNTDPYYLHQTYMPHPQVLVLSTHDPNKRYGVTQDRIPTDQHQTLPPYSLASQHSPWQSHTSYAPLSSMYAPQREIPPYHHSSYTSMPYNEEAIHGYNHPVRKTIASSPSVPEANMPVSSRYLFAGAAATYR